MSDLLQASRVLSLERGFEAVAGELPRSAGVVQLLDPAGRSLATTRPSNVRRWVHGQLGPRAEAGTAGATPGASRPTRRPALDLRPLAAGLRFVATQGGFEQRLLHERWLAECVPLSERRDLKPPFYLHLDPHERFPRVQVRAEVTSDGHCFGPFRDRAQAERALKPLHRRFPLRPCDFDFEPAADLPLGVGCFYAQVKTCAAPCLVRIGERAYRALGAAAAELLAGARAADAELAG